MKLNKRIGEIANEHKLKSSIIYLSCLYLYFKLQNDMLDNFFDKEVKQLGCLGILDYDYKDNQIIWNVPLFEHEIDENGWEWVLEIRSMFTNIRKDAGGSPKNCILKMQKFLGTHPEVRLESIKEAAKLYLTTLNDPKYLQRFDYFISKLTDSGKQSRLEEYLDIIKDKEETINKHKMI
jgi:hypothetical protein